MKDNEIFWKSVLTNGAILGFATVIFSFLMYIADIDSTSKINYLSYLIYIGLIVYGQKQFRKENNDVLSYGKALGYGVLMGIFGGIIAGIWQYIMFTVIDPDLLEKNLKVTEQLYYESGMSEDQIELMMENARQYSSPLLISVGYVFGSAIISFIISLITSIFVKKDDENFESIMNNIESENEN